MTCQTIQNRVLALPDPRQLPENLREHVAGCPGCQAWWKQAVRLDRFLEQLPAPPAPADKKAAMLDELAAAGPVIRSIPAVDRGTGRPVFVKLFAVPGVKYAVGLAAAVLIAVGGWMAFRTDKGPPIAQPSSPRDPFLEKIVKRNVALAQTKAPDERMVALAGLADDLSAETRGLARIADQDDLRELSGLFQKVVNDGIVRQAERLPPHALTPTQKQALLEKLSATLDGAKQQADQAARESPPHAQPALKTISDTARDGQTKLKALLGA